MAPPPATTFVALKVLLTTIIASFKDLSASFKNYSAQPLNIIVAVFDLGHSLKILYLSAPNYTSSNYPQFPNTASVIPLHVVWILPPVA